MIGLRTQFVHLYVKDLTEDAGAAFEDYGLYTQVEQLNKTALKNHGLDANGQLYKINSFEFYRYEDVIRLQDDPEYDQTAFEELLEIKGDSDHSKLIAMLEAVNDNSIPISTVLDRYFDRENLTYWMAFQILTGNVDTQNRNMFLYSPLNSDTWYFPGLGQRWKLYATGICPERSLRIRKAGKSGSAITGAMCYFSAA